MAVLWKNVLIGVQMAGALVFIVAGVRSAAKVKAIEAPKGTGLLDRWNETLVCAVFGLALLGGA